MRPILGLVLVAGALAGGCAHMRDALAKRGHAVASLKTSRGELVPGMTSADATRIMGQPDRVTVGGAHGNDFYVGGPRPGYSTVEWEWAGHGGAINLAWLDGGVVVFVGAVDPSDPR